MIEVVSNTLKPHFERWDDPGDYPSAAGSGPLPSHTYIDDWEGELILRSDDPDVSWDALAAVAEEEDFAEGAIITEWGVTPQPGGIFHLIPTEWEYE
jgi:hypothetical protein